MRFCTLLPLFLPAALSVSALAAEWFVSPQGNDSWSGRLAVPNGEGTDGPFATLQKARDTIRQLPGARTVILRGGLYELPKGLQFTAEDAGRDYAPVIWQAFEKETPVLIGGRSIEAWRPWKDGIVRAELGSQGFAGASFRQLLYRGARQILARYPNFNPAEPVDGGWAYVEGEMWPMYAERQGEDRRTLQVASFDWRSWANPQDVEVFIFPRYNWWNDILPIERVDPERRVITTKRDASYAMRANDRYYFQGALEDLDAPGEWHLDRRTGTVYFYPPGPIDRGSVYAPTAANILNFGPGADYISLRGLTFECSEGTAIVMRDTQHNRVIGCTLRNVGGVGGNGIAIQGGRDNGVVGCDLYQVGRDAISLGGGDVRTLQPAGNFVDNCYIHHPGVFYKQGVGVSLSGVGQRVAHTLIHDTPRFGLMFSGNDHVLEFNHLRHLALETEDVGATYCGGRDWISPRGTVIRYNFIHDVLGYGWNGKWTSPYFAWGIYLDDNSGGVDVIGNIVARCGRSLLHGHSARDCRVENNILIEGGLRQWEFNGWTTQHRFWETHLPTMEKGYAAVVDQPAWKGRRGMDIPPAQVPDAEGRVMSGNIFTRNIMAWQNDDAKALNVVAFDPSRNQFDRNLYWHDGKPLKTGVRRAGRVIGGNLAPNAGFDEGQPGALPASWQWQIHPPTAQAGLVEEAGQRLLRIGACFDETKKRDNFPIIVSREVELKPGVAYRLAARYRSEGIEQGKAALQLQFYLPPKNGSPGHFWASSPAAAQVLSEWKSHEFAFSIPARGEKGWHEQMGRFRIRLDWPEKVGALLVDDVVLEETETLDEWQSWQELGGDRASIIADPKFIDPRKDDYRLAPDSPAWALGFQPIPVEKIGPYASPDRATWPIVEAPGARERLARRPAAPTPMHR